MSLRILITGSTGQLGHELELRLGSQHRVIGLSRADCDLCSPDKLRAVMREVRPGVVLNCAAYTNVNGAESEPERAHAVNAVAPGVLAEEALRLGALLVHFSTDYVFDGLKDGAYVEGDAPAPLNVYGATKLAGEEAIAAAGGRYYVFRTSWVYSGHGQNFVRTVLKLAREREVLRVVDDQVGAPTSTRQLADAMERVLAGGTDRSPGVYHLTAAGAVSWCGLARSIVARAGDSAGMMVRQVVGVSSEEFASPARRPRNSVLSNRKFRESFGFTLEAWEQALDAVLAELGGLKEVHAGR